jgi:hypothetical protein
MAAAKDLDEVHQAIGEFVVFFQSVEDLYRQIGWKLVDPEQREWPPKQFRKESNKELIDKVTDLYIGLTQQYSFPNGAEKAVEAEQLRGTFHRLRKFRNRMVHSAYHEVKGGGEVVAILRTNPRITVDPDTGEIEYDQETFDPDTIRRELAKQAQPFFVLHYLRVQLLHWYPFDRYERDA